MKPWFHFYLEEIDPYTAVIASANKGIATYKYASQRKGA
tara:strand:+ start:316 stop:432 length:117 start_codon:yes stop_codon:yes gene_type:complete